LFYLNRDKNKIPFSLTEDRKKNEKLGNVVTLRKVFGTTQ
jgi:hypothetical protein